jgi:hypothetical protein
VLIAINDWIIREKAAGRWAIYDEAIVTMGDGSKAFKLINLVDPILASCYTEVNTLANNDLYIAGDATNARMLSGKDLGFSGSNYTDVDSHLAAIWSSFTGTWIIHNSVGLSSQRIANVATGNRYDSTTVHSPEIDLSGTVGEFVLSKISTTAKSYVNGGSATSHTSGTVAPSTLGKFYFFGRGNNSTFNASQLQEFTRGGSLSDADAAAWRTSALLLKSDITAAV